MRLLAFRSLAFIGFRASIALRLHVPICLIHIYIYISIT